LGKKLVVEAIEWRHKNGESEVVEQGQEPRPPFSKFAPHVVHAAVAWIFAKIRRLGVARVGPAVLEHRRFRNRCHAFSQARCRVTGYDRQAYRTSVGSAEKLHEPFAIVDGVVVPPPQRRDLPEVRPSVEFFIQFSPNSGLHAFPLGDAGNSRQKKKPMIRGDFDLVQNLQAYAARSPQDAVGQTIVFT